ncbi:acyltransferase [Fructilactobacillus sanfranciscensis]|uniref:acyltransferase n=1 Tax=Fructilactobacillus sanfranciscensis TaxID=1625 RepID=UPI0031F8A4FD
MPKINNEVSKIDKFKIIYSASLKLIRGYFSFIKLGIHKNQVFLGKSVSITMHNSINLGNKVKFESFSQIQGLSKKGLYFGNNTTIGRYTMIRPSSYYGTGNIGAGMEIGDNSSIGPMSYIGCAGYIKIGKNVMIGPKNSMFAENHNFSNDNVSIKEQGVTNKGIIIEDNCWIGSNVTILDGVTIGKGSVIGANTVITKNIPEDSIVFDYKDKRIKGR